MFYFASKVKPAEIATAGEGKLLFGPYEFWNPAEALRVLCMVPSPAKPLTTSLTTSTPDGEAG